MSDVTKILNQIEGGDASAAELLLPIVYDELRKLAASRMANEKAGNTLQPTALVHEAYIRLTGENGEGQWNNRGHFFGAAAEAMRRILVENARRNKRKKRGGDAKRLPLDDVPGDEGTSALDLLALDEALMDLESNDRRAADLVKLRYFAGFSHVEAANALGITRREADGSWKLAKAWLYSRLKSD